MQPTKVGRTGCGLEVRAPGDCNAGGSRPVEVRRAGVRRNRRLLSLADAVTTRSAGFSPHPLCRVLTRLMQPTKVGRTGCGLEVRAPGDCYPLKSARPPRRPVILAFSKTRTPFTRTSIMPTDSAV